MADTDQRAYAAARKMIQKAIRAAQKKVRVISDKKLEENLDYATGGDACESYRLGVEEAQGEIIDRLRSLEKAIQPPPQPRTESPSFSPNFDERNGIR